MESSRLSAIEDQKYIYKYKTNLYCKQDLKIIKLACLENDQVHATFNDNTSVIVYPGFSKKK